MPLGSSSSLLEAFSGLSRVFLGFLGPYLAFTKPEKARESPKKAWRRPQRHCETYQRFVDSSSSKSSLKAATAPSSCSMQQLNIALLLAGYTMHAPLCHWLTNNYSPSKIKPQINFHVFVLGNNSKKTFLSDKCHTKGVEIFLRHSFFYLIKASLSLM